ncbi:hypothetical protein [Flavobacterium terrae]|uniref:Uncharacterized protein n=1 Tax=Flavobacterium terrae TaxID=415425 RepID=A0A1M6CXA6_9FLAO|nr:hypothetical protein [Flavobacterium terrae]SHI65378.1 hypothetical protein SAMN05444363_1136 [Flavobacterium terrae]
MKHLPILLFFIILFSCNENKKSTSNTDLPFFHFDKVEYYHPNITQKEFQSIIMNSNKTREDEALLQILTGNVPVSIKDTMFIKNMEILNFEKDVIDPKLHSKISHLFSLREKKHSLAPTCKSDYKDILIFREKNIIVGMAKISFDCKRHQMIGERYNDSKFGQSGEYEELKKILSIYNE